MNSIVEAIRSADISLMVAINSLVGRSAAFDEFILMLETWKLLLYGWMAAYIWWAWFARPDEASRRSLLTALIGVAIATPGSVLLQHVFNVHPRPFLQPYGLTIQLIEPPHLTDMYQLNSFPSDTITMCFAVSTAIFLQSRKVGVLAFVWSATVATFPRLYLAYHWPLDIVGAFVLAVATVGVMPHLAPVRWLARFLVALERFGPAYFYPLAFVFTQQISELFHGSELALRFTGKMVKRLL